MDALSSVVLLVSMSMLTLGMTILIIATQALMFTYALALVIPTGAPAGAGMSAGVGEAGMIPITAMAGPTLHIIGVGGDLATMIPSTTVATTMATGVHDMVATTEAIMVDTMTTPIAIITIPATTTPAILATELCAIRFR